MIRIIIAAIWFSFVFIGGVSAQNCVTYPNTLTNGTNADANQVMQNFSFVLNCANAAAVGSGAGGSGFVNKIRNGTMDVWQRGTAAMTVTTSGAYTADGWIVLPTGASVTAQAAAGRLLTVNSLKVTGNASVTDVTIKQRIESFMAAPLTSQNVTVQAWVLNSTGASITPTLTVRHANAADNWSAYTQDVGAVPLQGCANGAWTQVAYTFAASASSAKGLEIVLDFGSSFSTSSASLQIAEVDVRVASPSAAIGLTAAPPTPELRPYPAELALNQRYYEIGNFSYINPQPGTSAAQALGSWIGFRATKRVSAPTITQTNVSNNAGFGSTPGYINADADGFMSQRISITATNGTYAETWTASGEL
jgi:hypothetical protein